MKKKIVLIGTGVSGLSCLYFLLKKSANKIDTVEIFEKESSIGGVLAHTKRNGFLFEHGAQGVLSSRTHFSSLVNELSLTQNISVLPSKKAERFFFIKNQIVLISPKNIVQMFRIHLISVLALLRILGEFFVKKQKNIKINETVEEFFSRRFGKTFAKNFLAPVMKGIWGGGMSRILMRWAFPALQTIEQENGSILKYFFKHSKSSKKPQKQLISFESGMVSLTEKLLNDIQNICTKENISFQLNLGCPAAIENLHQFDLVLYSGQPWKEERFWAPRSSRGVTAQIRGVTQCHPAARPRDPAHAFEILKTIPTHSLIVVGIGSANTDIQKKLDGFGALAVENNSEGVLGVIAVHSLNPGHVPKDSFLYRIMMGGENIPQNVNFETCADAEIIQLAKQYLQKYGLLEEKKTYRFEQVVRHLHYLPLPTEHQEKVLNAISELEKRMSGVFFVGNYLMGPAVDACIAQSQLTAEKMSQYLAPDEK